MYLTAALNTIVSTVETTTGWTLGPQVGSSARNPGPNAADTFGIDLQSTNAKIYRDKGIVRMRHALVVDFTRPVTMRNQYKTLLAAMDHEQRVIDALQSQRILGQVRAQYDATTRTWNTSGERLRIILKFTIEHDLKTYS